MCGRRPSWRPGWRHRRRPPRRSHRKGGLSTRLMDEEAQLSVLRSRWRGGRAASLGAAQRRPELVGGGGLVAVGHQPVGALLFGAQVRTDGRAGAEGGGGG